MVILTYAQNEKRLAKKMLSVQGAGTSQSPFPLALNALTGWVNVTGG